MNQNYYYYLHVKLITFSKSSKVEVTEDVSMKNEYGIMRLTVLNGKALLNVRKFRISEGKFTSCKKPKNAIKKHILLYNTLYRRVSIASATIIRR
jgi:hypothetical protein